MKAVSLLSGGLDSTVATWLAAQTMEIGLALTCDYGQRAAAQEMAAAARIAAALGVPHEIVPLPWMARLVRNSLTDAMAPLPTLTLEQLEGKPARQAAAAVWIPNRNGLLLNIAAVYAEASGCEAIVVGFNAEEGRTFPDNTPAFVQAMEQAFQFSTRSGLRVIAPTAEMTKAEIVRAGRECGAPLHYVWSCYDSGPAPCGRCESCLRLQRALKAQA